MRTLHERHRRRLAKERGCLVSNDNLTVKTELPLFFSHFDQNDG